MLKWCFLSYRVNVIIGKKDRELSSFELIISLLNRIGFFCKNYSYFILQNWKSYLNHELPLFCLPFFQENPQNQIDRQKTSKNC